MAFVAKGPFGVKEFIDVVPGKTEGTAEVTITCIHCACEFIMTVDEGALEDWSRGAYIQDCFPQLDKHERELLISGTCTPCWDSIFVFDEDDEGDF